MRKHAELVKRTRERAFLTSANEVKTLLHESADAIEALEKRVAELEALSLARAKRADVYKEETMNSDEERHRLEARIADLEAENTKLRETNKGLSLKFTNLQHKIGKAVAVLGENDGNN